MICDSATATIPFDAYLLKESRLMEGKFRKDDIVYERINPFRKMVVKHFTNGLYYCHFPENMKRLFVYPERELMGNPVSDDK